MWEPRFRNEGYRDGLRSGEADRRLGIKNEYAFHSFETESQYRQDYSRGYRDGILNVRREAR